MARSEAQVFGGLESRLISRMFLNLLRYRPKEYCENRTAARTEGDAKWYFLPQTSPTLVFVDPWQNLKLQEAKW
jgi:hypothetical protein